jgi:PAB1-binding protein PBP1
MGIKKCVVIDGVYVPVDEYLGRRKADVSVPEVISTEQTKEGMVAQHTHEMTFRELRKFCSEKGIKYPRTAKRKDLLELIKVFYEKEV